MEPRHESPPPAAERFPVKRGTVTTFYNGACPVCGTEVGRYRRIDTRHGLGLGWCDISARPDAAAALGVEPDAIVRRLHAVDETGRLHVGVDAFIVLWSRLPRLRWLSRLTAHPLVRPLAHGIYDRLLVPALHALHRRRDRRRGGGARRRRTAP